MAEIAVYADWSATREPRRVGQLSTQSAGGGRELFDFEFDTSALDDPDLSSEAFDPRIGAYGGRQYPRQGSSSFGFVEDASPDRWGRMLMRRRHERDQRAGLADARQPLRESDFLLGVHDAYRVGGFRFRLGDTGPFLDDRQDVAAPPFVQLRALEAASQALERDEENDAPDGDAWLRMLIAPGGSLGGARPKASVVDPDGGLWIAKFPSVRDEYDVGAWEMVVHTLARGCGLHVPRAQARRFGGHHHTFLIKRFDRTLAGGRIHFASAMTLSGHSDGDDASSGVSYLELARVLIASGASTDADLRELWSRIVFSMLVSNTDDHLRNHGFLLHPGRGWALAPAFDVNPVSHALGLKLNVSEFDNALDLDLARSVAGYFRVAGKEADDIVANQRKIVAQWPTLAGRLGLSPREQSRLAHAFALAA